LSNHILVAASGPVATVTLNRPEQRNAISYQMWLDLGEIAARLGADRSVRCVVFRGAGDQAFSAGADIKDFPEHRHDSKSAARYAEASEGAMNLVERMPQPTISMVRGYCVGGGLELATCTDIRVAALGSKFGVPVSRISVVAGYREVQRIARLAGPAAAAYLLHSGRLIGHEEAVRCGLVMLAVPPEKLEEDTYALAGDIARGAPLSHSAHKIILSKVQDDPGLLTLANSDRALQFSVFDSSDFREGTAAFREKRPPKFTGS
jgi:enoyl-CoA hydratase/carnithine racemase